jgi:hypothetical protein
MAAAALAAQDQNIARLRSRRGASDDSDPEGACDNGRSGAEIADTGF